MATATKTYSTATTRRDALVELALRHARRSLLAFNSLLYPPYIPARHLLLLTQVLEQIERRERVRLIVTLPPRHGKSLTASTLFPAWYLGRHPAHEFIIASYAASLAEDFGRKIRNLTQLQTYQAVFPEFQLAVDSKAAGRWHTAAGGGLVATGLDGGITGRGADVLLIEDPIKDRREAESKTIRQQAKDWYMSTAYTRLAPGAAVIVIMTRWHDDDLAGWLLKQQEAGGDHWYVLNLPALAEAHDPLGRHEGEALWPDRFPTEVLQQIKNVQSGGLSSRDFEALYQGHPRQGEGHLIKEWWFPRYTVRPSTEEVVRVVFSLDTAFKEKTTNDFSVCTIWAQTKTDDYLLEVWREHVDYPTLKQAVVNLAATWHPQAVLIEDKASGQSLIQELRKTTTLPIISRNPKDRDKVTRLYAVTPRMEGGKVRLPERAPWLAAYLDELLAFNLGEFDDQVDSTTQALEWMHPALNPGVFVL